MEEERVDDPAAIEGRSWYQKHLGLQYSAYDPEHIQIKSVFLVRISGPGSA